MRPQAKRDCHHADGTGIGALDGDLAKKIKDHDVRFGGSYGATAWELGDEIAVPALGLGKKPSETPLGSMFRRWLHTLCPASGSSLGSEGLMKRSMGLLQRATGSGAPAMIAEDTQDRETDGQGC